MTWKKTRIKDIGTVYDGPHATPKESDTGPVFLGIKNITEDGRVDLNEIRHISEQEYPKWIKRVKPQKDDVVFTYEATLHRYAIIPENFVCCLGRRTALIRPNTNKVLPRFLLYYFLSPKWRDYISNRLIIGATVDRVSISEFPSYELRLPPLTVQNRIVQILSAYDDLIGNNLRRIQLLEEAAGCKYKLLLNERSSSFKTVAELGKVVTGKTPSTSRKDFYGSECLFVKTPDMHNQVYVMRTEQKLSKTGADSQSNKFVPENSVMVSCIGTVGVVSLASEVCQTNQQINTLIPNNPNHSFFLYFALGEKREELEALGSSGATFTNVNKSKFENIQLQIISDKDVEEFHKICKPIFELIKSLYKQNDLLRQAREILLPRLLSGNIDLESITDTEKSVSELESV